MFLVVALYAEAPLQNIVIEVKTDLYRKCGRGALSKSGFFIEAGTSITIGDQVTLSFDHEKHEAYPVKCFDDNLYILRRDRDRVARDFLEDKVEGRA